MTCRVVTFANRKYYRPFDNTDNPCCWQMERVGEDIEELLAEFGIDPEVMYEDWGAAWSWCTDGITHSMQLTCIDVDRAEYQVEYGAYRTKWHFFSSDVADENCDFQKLIPRLREFDLDLSQNGS